MQSGRERGLSSADIFRTRGVLQMRTFALLEVKSSDFSKFMMCPHGQGGKGWTSADILRTKGEGSIFRDFVRTSFMEAPNSTLRNFTEEFCLRRFRDAWGIEADLGSFTITIPTLWIKCFFRKLQWICFCKLVQYQYDPWTAATRSENHQVFVALPTSL